MDDFFHAVSRFIIIIPIAVVIIGLMTKFNQKSVVSPQKVSISPTAIIKPTSVPVQIDLTGPWVCQFSSPQATVSAFIKDKKIAAKIQNNNQVNNLFINGDCAYIYSQGNYSGEKICGISTYLNLFNLLPLNMFDSNLFKTILPGSPAVNIDSLKKGLNSCKKEVIKDEAVFNLPKNVLFKNK